VDTDVIIVGAGPVGLTLANDLGRRGVRTIIMEQKEAPQFLPKMERCNARSMEIFRRMGLADKIRAAGLGTDVPMDVYVVLTLDRPPLLHLPYPSVDQARAKAKTINDGSVPCEPYQLISQYTLEPLLKDEAEKLDSVDVRFGCEFLSFDQDTSVVTVNARTLDGKDQTIRAAYLVGCDGGASPVRKQLGIKLRGEGNIFRLHQALFRCDDLFDALPIGDGPDIGPGHGRHYHVADDKATFLIMQDSTKHFTLHSVVENEDEMKARFERTIAKPMKYEMLSCNEWRMNLLVADEFARDRVFLAGDSAHLVIPTGGLGMNTGVGDAADLAWKLDGAVKGWAGSGLLNSYEIERHQVGDRNVGASRYASIGRRRWRSQTRPEIWDDTPDGQTARDNLAAVADVEQRKTNEMTGAELGYRYVGSPVIWEEPGGPEHLFRTYAPTTWSGARLPHVWLDGGVPIQDAIPEGYVLLRLGGNTDDDAPLAKAFADIGAPFSTLDVNEDHAREVYERDLILLRPDLHVVWRSDAMDDDVAHLAAVATGHRKITDA